jgi:pSer/pThr/pTyr-binding forkhead associated (FHA) protein
LYASLVGGCVALFVGLVDRLMRSAWLRLRLGRNEGKEWPLDWAETYIGRNETAQVPLLGDPNVAPVHAVIRRHGGQYTVFDAGSPIGIAVNGQRVAQAVLLPGSVLQIGSFALEFLTKNAPHPARGPEAYPGQAYPMGASPVPVGVPASLPSANPPTIMSGAAHPAAATATLTALDGPLAGQRFPLSAQVEVGRDSPIIPLAHDSQVSRRHAALSPAVGSVELRDLGSTNGTFVNGARATTATLRPGDTVRFGGSSFRVDIS